MFILRRQPAWHINHSIFNAPDASDGPLRSRHGIYGDGANVPIDNRIDHRTGLPVYSLYGRYRKPSPKMLRGQSLVMIYKTSVRSFVSLLRYAAQACFESDIEVIVLDRPNPLGLKSWSLMDPEWMSYVGAFQVYCMD